MCGEIIDELTDKLMRHRNTTVTVSLGKHKLRDQINSDSCACL